MLCLLLVCSSLVGKLAVVLDSTLALELLVHKSLANSVDNTLLGSSELCCGSLARCLCSSLCRKSKNVLCNDLLDILELSSNICTLCLAREDNELGAVCFKTLNILVKRLLRTVRTTVVNSDTDTACLNRLDTCSLELCNGETTTETDLLVVLDGLATDNRAECVDRAREDLREE